MGMVFDCHGVSGGCWMGQLACDAPPDRLAVVHRGQVVAEARLAPAGEGAWSVAADLPGAVIDQGVHGLLLVAGPGDAAAQVLGRLTLIAGTAAGDELLAEVAQLRAELDLLKREFRRLAAGA